MDGLYVTFKMLQMLEDKPLRFSHGVATGDHLLWYDPQM
jgi:hypothetical protein